MITVNINVFFGTCSCSHTTLPPIFLPLLFSFSFLSFFPLRPSSPLPFPFSLFPFLSFSFFFFLFSFFILFGSLPDLHKSHLSMYWLSVSVPLPFLLFPLLPRFAGECGPPRQLKMPAPPSQSSQFKPCPVTSIVTVARLGTSWMHGGQSKTSHANRPLFRQLAAIVQ